MTDRVDQDRELWEVVDHSAPGRALSWLGGAIVRARADSRVVAAWISATHWWATEHPSRRMRVAGTMAIVGSLLHLALMLLVRPAGWWWTILPGMVLTFGLAATALSYLGSRRA